MFTHTSPSFSLPGLTARLSQIRFPSGSSPIRKKTTTLNPITMSPTRKLKRDNPTAAICSSPPPTKLQPSGTRQPRYSPHLGRARRSSAAACKSDHQDWHARQDADCMKSLPRRPVQRRPLSEVDGNGLGHAVELRRRSTVTRQRSLSARTVSSSRTAASEEELSEIYSLIDDHLAWNMEQRSVSGGSSAARLSVAPSSAAPSSATRPGSSGTMFVDFDASGDMEVSYRNGVNKKLPTPPVPAKPTPPRRVPQRKESVRGLRPSLASCSSRHDSVISSGAENHEVIDRYFDPRPRPSRSRQPSHELRRPYPPQVHRTQRLSTPVEVAPPNPSPSPITYTSPSGLEIRYHRAQPTQCTTNPSFSSSPAPQRPHISGYDPATQYSYSYDGRTMHVQYPSTPSRPSSHVSEYFDIPACTYTSSTPLNKASRPTRPTMPPHMLSEGGKSLPVYKGKEPGVRKKVYRFVRKMMKKLEKIGVMHEMRCASWRLKLEGETQTWVASGYVT